MNSVSIIFIDLFYVNLINFKTHNILYKIDMNSSRHISIAELYTDENFISLDSLNSNLLYLNASSYVTNL
jgi:hypothetical protein